VLAKVPRDEIPRRSYAWENLPAFLYIFFFISDLLSLCQSNLTCGGIGIFRREYFLQERFSKEENLRRKNFPKSKEDPPPQYLSVDANFKFLYQLFKKTS